MDEKVKNIFLFAGDGDFLRVVSRINEYPNKKLILICAPQLGNMSIDLQSAAHMIDDISDDASRLLTGDKFSYEKKDARENPYAESFNVQLDDAMDLLQDNWKWCAATVVEKTDDGKVVLQDEYGMRTLTLAELRGQVAPLGTWTLQDENPQFPSGSFPK
jgi:hypothetical protein